MRQTLKFTRRHFLASAGAAGVVAGSGLAMPSISRAQSRPSFTHGVQSGDVDTSSGMAWVRADRPSHVDFEWATTESFKNARKLHPLTAMPESDFAVKRLLEGLPSDQDIFWRAVATDLTDVNGVSEPITGRFRTAPASRRSVKFTWSGDTVGQGWGIDESRGGMKAYGTMARHQPDFFLHSGDTIYADGPLKESVDLKDGTVWKNIVTPEKSKVAETLDEYRGQWKYNLLDKNVRDLYASVPVFYQWDDHEVLNNWSSSKDLSADDRYTVKDIELLAARAARAYHEMTSIRYAPQEPGRVYRKIAYGPLVDVFFLDMRSYRGPNNDGMASALSPAAQMMGPEQIAWLKRELVNSNATWKVIAADMPLGLIVWDDFANAKGVEAVANGDNGPAKGRELEFADLLRFIKSAGVKNTVWLTADVHYTAAHHYSPDRAQFQDFEPFWEFVSGPIHAGTFGPNGLDMTFGPEVRFIKAPTEEQGQNLPPSAGLQFFGIVEVDGASEQMTVRLMDADDNELWSTTLDPQQSI
ncbi:alkaline phosphatase D family protein [Mangrovibrevibacter kandeliae]|uniref:alkaline phosphatase D family protein n=1 Tax=Mangrovibrevibacter kandeliae TaxID=2968473 RepID=UPI00211977D0|nr:alkaline phosphatase D family protein [Aurantimonas sp. CSK15Z-1]MCQ8781782.1 alkaline phosphatase D family protein [Aurantimonas sp. CSK15Z-1]